MQKNIFEILVLTALTVGLIWTILELTPKSVLLSLTIQLHYFKALHYLTKDLCSVVSLSHLGFTAELTDIQNTMYFLNYSLLAKNR